MHQEPELLKGLYFGPGDGNLQYYLYNYRVRELDMYGIYVIEPEASLITSSLLSSPLSYPLLPCPLFYPPLLHYFLSHPPYIPQNTHRGMRKAAWI